MEYKELIVYSPHPGVNILDVYIYKDNKLINQYFLGDLREQKDREIVSRYSQFVLKLKPNEKITIVTKVENYGLYRIGWIFQDFVDYQKAEHNVDFLYGLVGGFFIFFVIIASQLFVKSRKYGYLFIILDSIFVTIYMYAVYGVLYKLDVGIPLDVITFLAFVAIYIATIARILFIHSFFDLGKKYKHISKIILSFAFIVFVMMLNVLYAFYIDLSTIVYLKYHLYFYVSYPFVILFFSIYFWLKKEFLGNYFIFTQSINAIFGGINTLTVFGFIAYSWYSTFYLNIILLVDSLLLLSIQFFKDKKEYEKMLADKQMLLDQSRFFSIGQTVGNITHQWKQPISILSSQIMRIEALIDHKPQTKVIELKEDIKKINENMTFINDTLSSIKTLFKIDTTNKSKFDLEETINLIKINFEEIIINKNLTIQINIDEKKNIYGNQNLFIHAIKNIIQNSVDAILENDIKNAKIKITSNKENLLIIEDNAGGIDKKVIDTLFETSSSKSYGMGIGLSITKDILEKEFKKSIYTETIKNGTRFIIR